MAVRYSFHIVINFRVYFFALTDHIYVPLIEKNRDHLDSNLFALKRWEIFADHSKQRLCKYDFVQLYESKKCDTYVPRVWDVDRRIRSRPGCAYETL